VKAVPAKYFAFPPYQAEDLGGKMGWWGVMNKNGFNCLTFPDKPGAVVTTEERAKQIAVEWNKEMTSFQTWEQRNLAKFAAEANKKMLEQKEEIKALREDLRVALDAYRQLLTKETK
jgi:hypothetical protein